MLKIQSVWLNIIKSSPFVIRENGKYILIGDGVKQVKEGRRMPGVKWLHQESDNSADGEYIRGHMFGALGMLIGNGTKTYSVLIFARLHAGLNALSKWSGRQAPENSHVVQMICDAKMVASNIGESLLLLDRLFLTAPMLQTLSQAKGLDVITKAKSNAAAYFSPEPYKGRGARPKKGKKIKVFELFDTHRNHFVNKQMDIYGKSKTVRYFCIDLHWGKGVYRKVRFVLTEINGVRSALVSTDLLLSPCQIIRLYARRFKIECSFREFKQVVAGFSYRFWSKVMPKFAMSKCNDANQTNLENISDHHQRKQIKATVRAIEGFVLFAVIAFGLLQLISLQFDKEINRSNFRFLRTISNNTPSERTVADYLSKYLFMLFRFFPQLSITSIIVDKQFLPFHLFHDSSA